MRIVSKLAVSVLLVTLRRLRTAPSPAFTGDLLTPTGLVELHLDLVARVADVPRLHLISSSHQSVRQTC